MAGAGLALSPVAGHARAQPPAETGVPFGSAIQAEYIESDPAYRQAFLDYCDLIMPMNELKFGQIRPTRETWNFEPADKLVDFALSHGRKSRGTCHVWWNSTPDWVEALETPAEAEKALVEHIERVTDRYRGRLQSWDVVNEVVANDPIYDGRSLRDTVWLRKLGPRHIPIAFEATARADPAARLVINDYNLEFAGAEYDARRRVMLGIVQQLHDRNIRVDTVGIQGHLYTDHTIDTEALLTFQAELRKLGVGLMVTELDVIDWQKPADAEAQDARAEAILSDFLDAILADGPPEAVIAWGMTDRYSWIPDVLPRPDGATMRPLPLDREMREKSWMALLRKRLRTA
ncbi:endo-1,4-beta-xylanase [Aurantimonas sp. VKM B-3413]|uniref:endo-1,4-beta-xylanase n=1 Tax=Aurantimonas sp. VKM B-3413 TaxID=2779401 RepID=UPI001E6395F1|nr:endo-1,4-beta-xylanase [Aurantimonas sp. VKM B-3413]MCB8839600.1 endo-1,4-beta-xylanase [Aurantimonas sp. VKM B-3413]